MKLSTILPAMLALMVAMPMSAKKPKKEVQLFPDGVTVMSPWFSDTTRVDVETLGRKYVITDFGVTLDSTVIQTKAIQSVIDKCAQEGGGVVVIPKGTFLTGAIFFKPKTHLHLCEGAELKGIDDIRHYPLVDMHMEGKLQRYFSALVNAFKVNGFTITGKGTIDGNGRRFWDEFWIRRQWNRNCTNIEALRPQLVYLSGCDSVTVQGVRLVNSGYWTNHAYRCNHVIYQDCYIEAPTKDQLHTETGLSTNAPSSDGIDLDVCSDVIVRNCYLNINDDGVCLKGGKGTYVDKDPNGGPVYRVLVENCKFGPSTNAGVTFGSEAFDCNNIIMRNCTFDRSPHMLLFKMRRDTPQMYQNVLVENCSGTTRNAIEISTWSQFTNIEKRDDMPVSFVKNVTIRNINMSSDSFFAVRKKAPFDIENFTLQNITATDRRDCFEIQDIKNIKLDNVTLNGVKK